MDLYSKIAKKKTLDNYEVLASKLNDNFIYLFLPHPPVGCKRIHATIL